MQDKNESLNTSEKINGFIQKNRKGIFIFLGAIIFLLIGCIVFILLTSRLNNMSIAMVEELNQRYQEIVNSDLDHSGRELDELLSDLYSFNKGNNYAGSKTWSIIAMIYSDREEWGSAEDAWRNAARTGSKTHLSPTALFNASVAAEEQGKIDQAIELLERSLSGNIEFPAAPRAQFAIGRLYEKQQDIPAAIEAYRAVLTKWPSITVWGNLAQSRIITLEVMR